MTSALHQIVEKEGKSETLFLFYADILNGWSNLNDSRIVQILHDDFKFEMLLRNFSLGRQLRIRNIKNEVDRYVKIINMLILKYITGKYEEGMDVEKIVEVRNKYGKPKLDNRGYQFNISDEDGMVSICMGFDNDKMDTDIGIDLANPMDIENFKLNKLEDFYKTDFRSIFGDDEVTQLDSVFKDLDYDHRLLKLSQMWALKESYCKYLGVGITAGMEKFQFTGKNELQIVDNQDEEVDDFVIQVKNIPLVNIDGYDPSNACFKMPNSKFICSIFGHYQKVCLIKIDAEKVIKTFI